MNATVHKLLTIGLLSLCAAGLSVQGQTASPGPNSRNANVDKEDPNNPDTPEHSIPNQEAPGTGNDDEGGAAGTTTPSGGDGSSTTENRDPTQHTQRGALEQSEVLQDCDALERSEQEMCKEALRKQTETVTEKEDSSSDTNAQTD